ncbi:unnamed protein product, partial [Rotaria sordida]
TSTSNQEEYSSSTAYKPTCKRKRTWSDLERRIVSVNAVRDAPP